jgi:hypothetical protein
MKKYFFLLFIFVLFFIIINCSLDKNPVSSYFNKYEGKWRWIKTTGWFATSLPEEGHPMIIQFDHKNNFKLFRNDTLKVNAKYEIERMEDYNGDRILYTNIVTYDYKFNREYEYPYLHGDTLELWDGMDDGNTRIYIKE